MTTGHVQGRRMRYPELETRYKLHETLGSGEKRVKTTGYEQSLSSFSVQVDLQRSRQLSTSSLVKGYADFIPSNNLTHLIENHGALNDGSQLTFLTLILHQLSSFHGLDVMCEYYVFSWTARLHLSVIGIPRSSFFLTFTCSDLYI